MKRRYSILLFIMGVTLLMLNQIAYTQSNSIRVALDVSFGDRIIEQRVISFINRELRTFNDIQIVESDLFIESSEDIHLKIIGMEAKSAGGYMYGYAITAIIILPTYSQENLIYAYWDSTMFTSPKDGLRSTSEDIIAWFDRNALEYIRDFIN